MGVPELPAGWSEVLDQIDTKHDDAHTRLRQDLSSAIATLASLTSTVDRNYRYFEDQNGAMRLRLNTVEQLAQRPVDGTTVVWSTKAIATVFSASLLVASAFIWVQFSLQAIHAEMVNQSAQIADLKKQREEDKREAQQRLNEFLNQRLNENLLVAGAKGTGK
jgi:hypothetical protein